MLGKILNAFNPLDKPGQAVNAFRSLVKGDIGGALKNAAPMIPNPTVQLASTLFGGQDRKGFPGAAASLIGAFHGKSNSTLSPVGNFDLGGNPNVMNILQGQSQQQTGGIGDLARTLMTALQNGQISEKDLLPLLQTLASQNAGSQTQSDEPKTGVFAEDKDGPETSLRQVLA
jgi:hypothetical protein